MRLFVGVWPSEDVLDAIEAMPRTGEARWTGRDQWHVTLRFLGEVEDPTPWIERVHAVASQFPPRTVTLGPETKMLGRDVLVIPASGLDDVAGALTDERFRGHLTLARRAQRSLAGTPITAAWELRDIALVRSHLGGGPARYETIATGAFAP
jgi:RNA 2',3'-cyclic 3'-phosphodiesterase